MIHVRGNLCINERTGLFTRCRGKVKKRRGAKKRARASARRAPRRSSAKRCKLFALYQSASGGLTYRCAGFVPMSRFRFRLNPKYVPGTLITAADYHAGRFVLPSIAPAAPPAPVIQVVTPAGAQPAAAPAVQFVAPAAPPTAQPAVQPAVQPAAQPAAQPAVQPAAAPPRRPSARRARAVSPAQQALPGILKAKIKGP